MTSQNASEGRDNMSRQEQIVKNQSSNSTKEHVMTTNVEQRTAAMNVDNAYNKALVASATYETAQADFMRIDAAAKEARDIVKKAKYDAKEAEAVYFEAVKSAFDLDKAAYAAIESVAKTAADQALPRENEVYDGKRFTSDADWDLDPYDLPF